MPVTKRHQEYANEYIKDNYDKVSLLLKPKGKKDEVKAHAKSQGESVNGFIARAIDEQMKRDNENRGTRLKPGEKSKDEATENGADEPEPGAADS